MRIDASKCLYCGACVGVCPQLALRLREVVVEKNDKCNECGICARACPNKAITVP
ncbi:MAG: 4Fe-4S binding protein [Candidatus Micrarchaeota archaeon]